jgi:4'-phosphopantetheinyl transferase
MAGSGVIAVLPLPEGDVHVWRARLDLALEEREALAVSLSVDERERAARFHFERDRNRFQVARGVLRELLGRYLGLPPARIELTRLPGGKPILQDREARLRFNVSHSGGLALLAFAQGRELGVDLEAERSLPEMESLAERNFSPAEVEAWRALAPGERPAAFFRAWTRKEAFLKATGEGLFRSLDSFDVALGPDEPARLLRVGDGPEEAERWHLFHIEATKGVQAALAVEGRPDRVCCRDWEGVT